MGRGGAAGRTGGDAPFARAGKSFATAGLGRSSFGSDAAAIAGVTGAAGLTGTGGFGGEGTGGFTRAVGSAGKASSNSKDSSGFDGGGTGAAFGTFGLLAGRSGCVIAGAGFGGTAGGFAGTVPTPIMVCFMLRTGPGDPAGAVATGAATALFTDRGVPESALTTNA